MIDVDSCESCGWCRQPVALIETAHTIHAPKGAPITALLARLAGLPAYSVSYSGTIERTRCEACGREGETGEIRVFLVRRIRPRDPWVFRLEPDEYAKFLVALRAGHVCVKAAEAEGTGAGMLCPACDSAPPCQHAKQSEGKVDP
jgi:hypothetical protein